VSDNAFSENKKRITLYVLGFYGDGRDSGRTMRCRICSRTKIWEVGVKTCSSSAYQSRLPGQTCRGFCPPISWTKRYQLECGPMPNVMAALPNVGDALCSTPQSLAHAHYYTVSCSNAAKMRNPLKSVGVPQTRQQISAVSGPKFTILQGHVDIAV